MTDLVVGHVSVVHPGGASCVSRDSREGGSAAAALARRKTQQHSDPGSRFVPLVSESYGRLCVEAIDFLHELAAVAASHGEVVPAAIVRHVRLQLSVALCKGNGILFRRGYGSLARVSGHDFRLGAPVPFAE
jgi:hypothetical protein